MQILSHRGYWKDAAEKNMPAAFRRSFDLGFGTETDLRDCAGRILVSHDMPRGGEMDFEELLKIMDGRNLPLALNIKADGLCQKIAELLQKYSHTNYFTFDMSVPDMVVQLKAGMKVFGGLSDMLPEGPLLDSCEGVWLDSFNGDWFDENFLDDLLSRRKNVCIVSSDLHKRDAAPQWARIAKSASIVSDRLMLCTDHPEKAKEYFHY